MKQSIAFHKSLHYMFPKLKRPKLITFDAFGTLFDLKDSAPALYSQLVKNHCGIHVPPKYLERRFPDVMRSMMRNHPQYGKFTLLNVADHVQEWWFRVIKQTFHPIELEPATISELYTYFGSPESYQVYEDVVPLLAAIKKDMIKVAVISNMDSRFQHIMDGLGLDDFFDKSNTFLSYDMLMEKPDPGVFIYARHKMIHGDDGYCWHVGDEVKKDYIAANKVKGWKGFLIDRDNSRKLESDSLVLHDLRDLNKFY